jgi:pilus assembly protein Flp/PilA
MKLISIFRELIADARGATAVEYGLILALIVLAMLGALSAFSTQMIALFTDITTTSVTAMRGA